MVYHRYITYITNVAIAASYIPRYFFVVHLKKPRHFWSICFFLISKVFAKWLPHPRDSNHRSRKHRPPGGAVTICWLRPAAHSLVNGLHCWLMVNSVHELHEHWYIYIYLHSLTSLELTVKNCCQFMNFNGAMASLFPVLWVPSRKRATVTQSEL